MAARARARGWAPRVATCAGCGLSLVPPAKQLDADTVSHADAGRVAAAGRSGSKKGKYAMKGTVEVAVG